LFRRSRSTVPGRGLHYLLSQQLFNVSLDPHAALLRLRS
jgi:hypothetical protein